MDIIGKGRIYKNNYGYSISDNQKDQRSDKWENYYIPVTFPKSMGSLPNDKEDIEIKGFTKHYKDKAGNDRISIMVMEWNLQKPASNKLENAPDQAGVFIPQDTRYTDNPNYVWDNGGSIKADDITLSDDDLPF